MTPKGIRISATIIMIVFGLIGLVYFGKLFPKEIGKSPNKTEILMAVFSIFSSAISAGIVFG